LYALLTSHRNALLAAILADATNLGLGRMAAASHGVTRDKLIWIADAYIRPETYRRRSPGSSTHIIRYQLPPSGGAAPRHHRIVSSFDPPSAETERAM
jgi:hypothetical protein